MSRVGLIARPLYLSRLVKKSPRDIFVRREAILAWARGLGPFDFFLTVTVQFSSVSEAEFHKAIKLFLNRLNRAIFGRRARRGCRRLASLVAVESGRKFERLHAHLCIGKPPDVSAGDFRHCVKILVNLICIFGYCDIRVYREDRHLSYVLKGFPETLLLDACCRAK